MSSIFLSIGCVYLTCKIGAQQQCCAVGVSYKESGQLTRLAVVSLGRFPRFRIRLLIASYVIMARDPCNF
jgi:hypothetical protein